MKIRKERKLNFLAGYENISNGQLQFKIGFFAINISICLKIAIKIAFVKHFPSIIAIKYRDAIIIAIKSIAINCNHN